MGVRGPLNSKEREEGRRKRMIGCTRDGKKYWRKKGRR
jgi:hypothetical protein